MGTGTVFEACSPSDTLQASAQALHTEGNCYKDRNQVCSAISVPMYLGGFHAKRTSSSHQQGVKSSQALGPPLRHEHQLCKALFSQLPWPWGKVLTKRHNRPPATAGSSSPG